MIVFYRCLINQNVNEYYLKMRLIYQAKLLLIIIENEKKRHNNYCLFYYFITYNESTCQKDFRI